LGAIVNDRDVRECESESDTESGHSWWRSWRTDIRSSGILITLQRLQKLYKAMEACCSSEEYDRDLSRHMLEGHTRREMTQTQH
jgi:hypothetical protein